MQPLLPHRKNSNQALMLDSKNMLQLRNRKFSQVKSMAQALKAKLPSLQANLQCLRPKLCLAL